MVFDAVNEAINKYRPYGEDGVPMPWSSSTWRLCSNDILNFEKVFNGIKDVLFSQSQTLAGTMPRKEFMTGDRFDEEVFTDIREKWLATLLSKDVANGENKWLNYFFEESQVKIDITDMILEDMIHEICILLNTVEQREGDQTAESFFKNLPEEYLELLQ